MVPVYPDFKKLKLDDKEEIEKFTTKFLPYSDFNFTSLYSYNTNDDAEISFLNENLVIKFRDYITNEPFYTFLGSANTIETAKELLKRAQTENAMKSLKLIPDVVIESDSRLADEFEILEDPDNFDYILSAEEIKSLKGNKYRGKRNFVNRLTNLYEDITPTIINLKDPKVQVEIEELFIFWKETKSLTHEDIIIEFSAIKRLLAASDSFNLISLGIYINNRLVAFSIDEIIQKKYSIIHFEKADTNFTGLFQYLKMETAEHVFNIGVKFINYEQDLGIPGLKQSKSMWNPIHYLKKYTITEKL